MYKAVSVMELLLAVIQSWLKEEATLVMKAEKNITDPWDQKNKTPSTVFWYTLKPEVRPSVLHYLRVGRDSVRCLQALWPSGKGLYLTGQKFCLRVVSLQN